MTEKDLMIQDLQEENRKLKEYITELEKSKWIPVTWHETTDDDGIDKDRYPLCLDCKMPDDGQEILICTKNGYVYYDTCFNEDGYYLDSGRDWIEDIIAWQPLPEPYKEG